jgi:tetratricopeptide (TPR) repeat protein
MADKVSRARAARERKGFGEEIQLGKELMDADPQAMKLLIDGWQAYKLERWQEAQDALEQALELKPQARIVMQALGHLWVTRTDKVGDEKFRKAEDWLLKASERGKTAPILSMLGSVYVELENIPRAVECFEEALKVDPAYEESMCNLAVLISKDDPLRAISLLETAVEIDPDYAIAHQKLGGLYQLQKDGVRAEFQFRRCIEIDAADYWSYLYLANLLAGQRRDDEAEGLVDFAMHLNPEYGGEMGIFVKLLERRGKNEKAALVRSRKQNLVDEGNF